MLQGPTTRSKVIAQKNAQEAQSTSPPQTKATPQTGQRQMPEIEKQTNQKSRYEAARKYLAKKGLLETLEPCNPATLACTLKMVASSISLPDKSEIALAHIGELVANLQTHCKSCEKANNLPGMFSELHADVQYDLDNKLDDLGTRLEKKIAEQGDIAKRAETLEEATKALSDLIKNMGEKITKVTDSTAQLTSTANTYRDALLGNPTPRNAQTGPPNSDPAISAAVDRKERQVMLQLSEAQIATLSQHDLMEKAKNALKHVEDPPPPPDITITKLVKLRKGSLILQFKTKKAVEWIQNLEAEFAFSTHFLEGAIIKPRQYTLLVPRAPTMLEPGNNTHLREIEEANGIAPRTIVKARWIKPERRRKLEQRVAHATFILNDPKAANNCIKEGLFICGMRVYPARLKQEPTQCMKCRHWGHFANDCLEDKDTCGTCGGEHRSSDCTEPDKRHCVSCKANTHASWDRNCPEFIRKCSWYDQKHPDNLLKYFPTDEKWSKETRPERIPLPERFPAWFTVASLPPQTRNGREMPTRELEQHSKQAKGKGKMTASQTMLDRFMAPSQMAANTPESKDGEITQNSSIFHSAESFEQTETWSDIVASKTPSHYPTCL